MNMISNLSELASPAANEPAPKRWLFALARRVRELDDKVRQLEEENFKLKGIVEGLAARVAAQSELLSRKAER